MAILGLTFARAWFSSLIWSGPWGQQATSAALPASDIPLEDLGMASDPPISERRAYSKSGVGEILWGTPPRSPASPSTPVEPLPVTMPHPPDDVPRYDPLADLRQRSAAAAEPEPGPPRPPFSQRLAQTWPVWAMGLLVAVTGVGAMSAISLFRVPNLPNCRAIFWPMASATTRLQCAEAYAQQTTVEGYLEAIALVESLPADHPLRGEINLRIETWSENILDLAEDTFQTGELAEAIAIVRRIPDHTAAAQLVAQQVREWNQIWQEAETIYQAAEADLDKLAFQDAFAKAIQLLDVGNTHWETVRYDELTAEITAAREDLNQLGKAKELARQRTLRAMQEAIALAQKIPSDSPVYGEAQTVLREFGRDLIAMAEDALDRRDATAAGQMLAAIPAALGMGEEIADMRTLTDASQLSWQGGISGLEGAIVRLQSIGADRPLYAKAQALMRRWQEEVQGRTQLEWARQVALPGTAVDLQAAIIEANKISQFNAAWPDAETEIGRWRRQIQTTEDRPILNQAEQQAQLGDLAGAIATARQIGPSRALHSEAQTQIDQWRDRLQRAEDSPLLAEARQLAAQGRLSEAVAVASRIGPGRALYGEAQTSLKPWQDQIQGQQLLGRAYQSAQVGTAVALAAAVRQAQQVPEGSPQRTEAVQALTRWSWDILRLAETEAPTNLDRAIAIAETVPAQTEAYAQAQLRLQEWRAAQPQPQPPLPRP